MQLEMTVVSKIENPPKADRAFTRYVVALQPPGGGALLELTFDAKDQADQYVVGQTVSVNIG